MKKIWIISFMAMLLFSGCGNSANTAELELKEDEQATSAESVAEETDNGIMEFVARHGDVWEYRDKETGVHYLIYCHEDYFAGYGGTGYGIGASMCPRYNADGTLYVD